MISLKKYLDMETIAGVSDQAERDPLSEAVLQCYRGMLLAIGKSAVQGCPVLGTDLEQGLQALEHRLAVDASVDSIKRTQQQAEVRLQEWGQRTAEHFQTKADEVKELLIALAGTAEALGSRHQGYAAQFKDVTARLETIANLDDVTQIRSSLVKRVEELRQSVDQMTKDSRQLVDSLRAEVSTYESRLRVVEEFVLKDELTGVSSRRTVEERINMNIANELPFCVVMLDLNGFKHVNDEYGHLAGDDLLRQFATELNAKTRASDMVGRWGGDEFVVLLSGDAAGAQFHMNRIREWVFGKYTIQSGAGKKSFTLHMDAAMGLAEWRAGQTLRQVMAEADASMYREKRRSYELHA